MLILKIFRNSSHANASLMYIASIKEARQTAIGQINDFIKGNASILAEWNEVDKNELADMIDTTQQEENKQTTPYQELVDQLTV